VVIFGLARGRTRAALPPFAPTNETTERVVLRGPQELAFPSHTEAAAAFFARRKRRRTRGKK
jgi:hypothetical protein